MERERERSYVYIAYGSVACQVVHLAGLLDPLPPKAPAPHLALRNLHRHLRPLPQVKAQHTSAYVSIRQHMTKIRQHTSAYVSTSKATREIEACLAASVAEHTSAELRHTSAYVSIRQHTIGIRQHT